MMIKMQADIHKPIQTQSVLDTVSNFLCNSFGHRHMDKEIK